MNLYRSFVSVTTVLLLVVLLVGCSSSEERQAKYLQRAEAKYESGENKKALVEVRNVLQINPENTEALYLWALIQERQNNWEGMHKSLLRVVELKPKFVLARIKLAELYYHAKEDDRALEQADAVLAIESGNADAHTVRGSIFFRRGDNTSAVNEAQLALASIPTHVGAISILTEVYKSQDPERALAVIRDGIERQTENAILKLLEASVLEEKGDTKGAAEVYKSLIAEYPENLFYYYRIVKFYEQLDLIDEAEALLREIVKTKPEDPQLKLWLAEFLANQHDLKLAETTLLEFIDKQPNLYELRFGLAKVYRALKQDDNAVAVYQEVVKLDERGADGQRARNILVELYLARGEENKALTLTQEILAIEPENSIALVAQAGIEIARNNPTAAVPLLRTVLRNSPDNIEALLLLAQANEAAGSVDLALDNYRSALIASPDNETVVINQIRLLIEQDDIDSTQKLLDSYLESYPENSRLKQIRELFFVELERRGTATVEGDDSAKPAKFQTLSLYLKGHLAYEKGDYASAIEMFTEQLQLDPNAVEAMNYLIMAYLSADRQEQAIEFLNTYSATYPDQVYAHELLGMIYRRSKDFAGAIRSYKNARKIAPSQETVLFALAEVYLASGDVHSALKVSDEVLELAPENIAFLTLRAGAYETLGEYGTAAEVYRKIISVDPDQMIAANNLAIILVDHLPSTENIELALKLTKNFDDSVIPTYLDTRGWVYYQSKDYIKALPLLLKAVKEDRSQAVFRYHLGMTYFKLNDKAAAKTQLAKSFQDGSDYFGRDQAKELEREL
jgi:cellulose synthase operon protein C